MRAKLHSEEFCLTPFDWVIRIPLANRARSNYSNSQYMETSNPLLRRESVYIEEGSRHMTFDGAQAFFDIYLKWIGCFHILELR